MVEWVPEEDTLVQSSNPDDLSFIVAKRGLDSLLARLKYLRQESFELNPLQRYSGLPSHACCSFAGHDNDIDYEFVVKAAENVARNQHAKVVSTADVVNLVPSDIPLVARLLGSLT